MRESDCVGAADGEATTMTNATKALKVIEIATAALAEIANDEHNDGCYGCDCFCASTKVYLAQDALKQIAAIGAIEYAENTTMK